MLKSVVKTQDFMLSLDVDSAFRKLALLGNTGKILRSGINHANSTIWDAI
jgi:hypothetical protein